MTSAFFLFLLKKAGKRNLNNFNSLITNLLVNTLRLYLQSYV